MNHTQIDGEYPAAANPCKNRPIRIIGRFWAAAIIIHPIISGMVKRSSDFLLPNLDPSKAEANPPNIAPNPNIPAERNIYLELVDFDIIKIPIILI